MNTQQRNMAICILITGLLIAGCGPALTPTPTNTAIPTNIPLPTATPTHSPLPLPLTTQPKCGTVLTSSEPEKLSSLGQSEITFILESNGMIQTLVKGGRFVIEKLEVKGLTIGGKKVTLTSQQLTGDYLQTSEFGKIFIITGDFSGSCMAIIVTPDQFTQIVSWLQ